MSRTVKSIERSIYDGRRYLGHVVGDGVGFIAYDANRKQIARFNTEAAAVQAVLDQAREVTDVR
jgi:hypothetical protein